VRVAVLGTELAALHESSGALERVVLGWARAPENRAGELDVVTLDTNGPPSVWRDRLDALEPDLVALNNRPLWAEELGAHKMLHVLHNFPDAWGTGGADAARVRAVLVRGTVAAVSASLAQEVQARYRLTRAVREVAVGVERLYFEEEWAGSDGPVLFPNRLLEKKGVRLWLAIAAALSSKGVRCVMSRHIAPWTVPTPEQEALLEAIEVAAGAGAVELREPPETRAAMAAWYASAGVVVCPSVQPEGLGLVALEAQAVGAPVVTSGLGGLADATFAPNETVSRPLVDPWCEAITRARRRRPSDGPRRRVAERHDPAVAARSWLGAVNDALAADA
jgi:glycosyltransferase involved in cell wall biosynthesis